MPPKGDVDKPDTLMQMKWLGRTFDRYRFRGALLTCPRIRGPIGARDEGMEARIRMHARLERRSADAEEVSDRVAMIDNALGATVQTGRPSSLTSDGNCRDKASKVLQLMKRPTDTGTCRQKTVC